MTVSSESSTPGTSIETLGVDVERWDMPIIGEHSIKPLTTNEIERLYNLAKEEGHKAGYEEGLRVGTEECQTRLKSIDALFQTFQKPMELITEAAEALMGNIITVICVKILEREASLDPSLLQKTIRTALELLPSHEEEIRVYLHPLNVEEIQKQLNENHFYFRTISLISDPEISVGSCRIQSPYSIVDASYEKRIEDLLSGHLGHE